MTDRSLADQFDARSCQRVDELHQRIHISPDDTVTRFHALDRGKRETRTLREGDVVVVNRGIEHELRSEGGCAFFEALAPVPLDHVGDRERDLVLGPDGGRLHVERSFSWDTAASEFLTLFGEADAAAA